MADTRRVIRCFLASPGDLQDERRAVRDVVTEINESLANPLGYHVDLMGWEETIAGYGRPQQLINHEVDRCDLFIGMMWKRWGTPPDTQGRYTSGFHEEFERSLYRHEQSGTPEVSLFFKEIPADFMTDPGSDLQKVLSFRDRIVSEKRILFQKFSTVSDMEKLARKCVTTYIMHVRAQETSFGADDEQASRARPDTTSEATETRTTESSPVLAEDFEFLEGLVARIRRDPTMEDLTGADVARFRLLANSISKPGNHERELGVHDINILFAACITGGMKLGRRETVTLVRLGFQHLSNENAPLWRWYSSSLTESEHDPAVIWSFAGANDAEKIGAIRVLTSLERELPDYEYLKRDEMISFWFSEGTSPGVKNAALSYLGRNGTPDDLHIARREYDRGDYGTSRSALECMLQLLLRTDENDSAQELLLNSQFDSLDEATLQAALEGFEDLRTEQLELGLEHRNSAVRLQSLKLLVERGCLDDEAAERMTGDSDALIRNAALARLSERGRSFSEEEVRRILAPPENEVGGIVFSSPFTIRPEKRGKELFEKYRLSTLTRLSEAELKSMVDTSLMYNDEAYFALVDRYFQTQASRLRQDVDDTYSSYFEERVQRTGEIVRRLEALGDATVNRDLSKQERDLEDFTRKRLTRRGFDVLCRKERREDAKRIRANLKSGYAGPSKLDAEYLEKHGEWVDISLLATADDSPGLGSWGCRTMKRIEKPFARAAYKIGRRSISKLMSLDMPATILQKVVELCAESRFSKISRDGLFVLLDNKADEVRRAAAIKAVLSFPSKRIRAILDEYVSGDRHRYYNVIHWLDLGVSMSRGDTRKVARASSSART
jgi:Domain of unknown function (DUF4062)